MQNKDQYDLWCTYEISSTLDESIKKQFKDESKKRKLNIV